MLSAILQLEFVTNVIVMVVTEYSRCIYW